MPDVVTTARPYVSALWQGVPVDLERRILEALSSRNAAAFDPTEPQLTENIIGHAEASLRSCLRAILTAAATECRQRNGHSPRVFFRADDIGVPSHLFHEMLHAHRATAVPLALAVVPAWLTTPRAQALLAATHDADLWLLHQHGWRHVNHQTRGKKCEFGTDRPFAAKLRDIERGKAQLASLLDNRFAPIFTPPWNRVDADALTALEQQGFSAISRSEDATPPSSAQLPDIPVNVDLHTRREIAPADGWTAFFRELWQALASGRAGIMLHHQRMNPNAVRFLHLLCEEFADSSDVVLVHLHNAVLR